MAGFREVWRQREAEGSSEVTVLTKCSMCMGTGEELRVVWCSEGCETGVYDVTVAVQPSDGQYSELERQGRVSRVECS